MSYGPCAVAIDGDTIVVGSSLDSERGFRAGAVYVYQRGLGGSENWGQVKKITASDVGLAEELGRSVAVDGSLLFVGADRDETYTGSAYLFSTGDFCAPSPLACVEWPRATLAISAKPPQKEKVKLLLLKGPALTLADLGTPLVLGGTAYNLCLYDDSDALVGQMKIDRAGSNCGGLPCWRDLGGKTYQYRDKNRSSFGVNPMTMKSGSAGQTKIQIKAAADAKLAEHPQGLAAALSGSATATVQLVGSDLAQYFSATLTNVLRDTGTSFKARK